jgi:hypothetical protein
MFDRMRASVYIVFLSLFIACNPETKTVTKAASAKDDNLPFPRLNYSSVSIFSVNRRAEKGDEVLKRLNYLEGYEAVGIIDSSGNPVHKKLMKIDLSKQQADELKGILGPSPEISDEPRSDGDCSPAYRDAIVFYDQHKKPLAWINICFTCERTMFVPRSSYMADFDKLYLMELKRFFSRLGYEPEGRPVTMDAGHISP